MSAAATDSVGASDIYAIVELSQLLKNGATSGLELAWDDEVAKMLAYVQENPADALLAAGLGDTKAAASALRSLADVLSAEIED